MRKLGPKSAMKVKKSNEAKKDEQSEDEELNFEAQFSNLGEDIEEAKNDLIKPSGAEFIKPVEKSAVIPEAGIQSRADPKLVNPTFLANFFNKKVKLEVPEYPRPMPEEDEDFDDLSEPHPCNNDNVNGKGKLVFESRH